ncbi:MAG: DapH/DapD/GlmU-related protein [Anaerolineae bacterium]
MQRGTGCQIGINASLSPDTVLGDNVTIGNNVTIYPKVTIGDGCRILDGAVIGRLPITTGGTTRSVTAQYLPVQIGPGCVIGCNSVLYTDVTLGEQVLIGDLSAVREHSVLEDLVVIGQCTAVHCDSHIGKRTRISYESVVGGIIEEDVFIAPGMSGAEDNNIYLSRFGLEEPSHPPAFIIHRFAVIGPHATIMPGVEIGEGAFVGAGAVVSKDVAPWKMVAGVPARPFRDIPAEWKEQVLSLRR